MSVLPLLPMLALVLWLWLEDRAYQRWLRHPDRPWNVQRRLAAEQLEWYRRAHRVGQAESVSSDGRRRHGCANAIA